MKLENLLLAALLFSTAAFTGVAFHNNLIGDYSGCTDCNATVMIESDRFPHEDITTQVSSNITDAESGLQEQIKTIPGFGTIFSTLEVAGGAIGALFSSADIGINLITILTSQPELQIPTVVTTNIAAALMVMVTISLLALIIKWRA